MEKTEKKAQTRARILLGAGRSFRSQGYGGAGVDGVAKAAGVTSGAFYAYFKSKAEAFRETVVSGMQDLEQGIRHFRAQGESTWIQRFVDFYLSDRRTCDLTESCALQSLTGEVARADSETRKAFETQLRAVIDATAEGIQGTADTGVTAKSTGATADTGVTAKSAGVTAKSTGATAETAGSSSAAARRGEAIVMLALLSGGVSLARAVQDPVLAEEIAAAIRASLLRTPQNPALARRPKK